MSGRFNWRGADSGREAIDAAIGRDWRNGPQDACFDRPDGSDALKLLMPPSIYWAAELKKAFPIETEEAHLDLFDAAWRSAATLYYRDGWARARARSKAIRERSSQSRPFPSAFYAAYFDFCLFQVARRDFITKVQSVPRHIADYDDISKGSIFNRCYSLLRGYMTSVGLKGFYQRLNQLEDDVWTRRKLALQQQPSPSM